MTGRAGPAAILASVVWDCTVSGPAPDGVCACALAFSTLLSSQGADAHHRRLLGSSGATLLTYRPALSLSTQFAGLGVVHYSLCNQHTRVRASRCRDALAGGDLPDPGALAPCGVPLPLGQDETLGSKRDQVKSGCTATAAMALACADRSRSGHQLNADSESAGRSEPVTKITMRRCGGLRWWRPGRLAAFRRSRRTR